MKKRKTKKSLKVQPKADNFFKTYFILAMIYAILGILDTLFGTGTKSIFDSIQNTTTIVWVLIFGFYQLAILILSIIALVKAIKQKLCYAKILPIVLLADFIIFTVLTMVSINLFVDSSGYFKLGFIIISVLVCLAELLLAIYSISRSK